MASRTLSLPDATPIPAVARTGAIVSYAAGPLIFSHDTVTDATVQESVRTSLDAAILCIVCGGGYTYAGYADGVIRVWKDGTCMGRYRQPAITSSSSSSKRPAPQPAIRTLVLSGHALFGGTEGGSLIRWNSHTAKAHVLFRGSVGSGPIRAIHVNKDTIVFGVGPQLRWQSIGSGASVHPPGQAHLDAIVCLSQATGPYLFSGGTDQRVVMWSAVTGTPLLAIQPPELALVKAVAFDSDAGLFAAAGANIYSYSSDDIMRAMNSSTETFAAPAPAALPAISKGGTFSGGIGDTLRGRGGTTTSRSAGVPPQDGNSTLRSTATFTSQPTPRRDAESPSGLPAVPVGAAVASQKSVESRRPPPPAASARPPSPPSAPPSSSVPTAIPPSMPPPAPQGPPRFVPPRTTHTTPAPPPHRSPIATRPATAPGPPPRVPPRTSPPPTSPTRSPLVSPRTAVPPPQSPPLSPRARPPPPPRAAAGGTATTTTGHPTSTPTSSDHYDASPVPSALRSAMASGDHYNAMPVPSALRDVMLKPSPKPERPPRPQR